MSGTYILDACALIACMLGEHGHEIVEDLLSRAYAGELSLKMNIINLMEVYYGVFRTAGSRVANEVIAEVERNPILITTCISKSLFLEAGKLKAAYRISLADAIALAEAIIENATLVTSDHHELGVIDEDDVAQILLIR